jgi:DNA polymerase-3 subunit alpha
MLNAYTETEDGEKSYTEISDGQQVTMGGMISAYKKLKTRSGAFMAFVTVEDLFGTIECVCFPKVYERIRSFLETDRVVSLSGKLSIEQDKAPAIIIDKMDEFTLEEEAPKAAAYVAESALYAPVAPVVKAEKPDAEKRLWLNVSELEDEDVEELLETLSYYAGETQVCFVRNGKKMLCSQKVTPNKALMAELASFLSENCIKLV